jgi:hypothetical protein
MKIKLITIGLAAVLVAGCQRKETVNIQPLVDQIQQLQKQIEELKTQSVNQHLEVSDLIRSYETLNYTNFCVVVQREDAIQNQIGLMGQRIDSITQDTSTLKESLDGIQNTVTDIQARQKINFENINANFQNIEGSLKLTFDIVNETEKDVADIGIKLHTY